MTFKKYNHTNNAFCELLTDLQSSDNTMMLTGNFNRLPTNNFIVKISKYQGAKCVARENIYVANRNNNICTGLVRAYEKVPMDDDAAEWIQQALNFSAGDIVECTISSEIIKDIQENFWKLNYIPDKRNEPLKAPKEYAQIYDWYEFRPINSGQAGGINIPWEGRGWAVVHTIGAWKDLTTADYHRQIAYRVEPKKNEIYIRFARDGNNWGDWEKVYPLNLTSNQLAKMISPLSWQIQEEARQLSPFSYWNNADITLQKAIAWVNETLDLGEVCFVEFFYWHFSSSWSWTNWVLQQVQISSDNISWENINVNARWFYYDQRPSPRNWCKVDINKNARYIKILKTDISIGGFWVNYRKRFNWFYLSTQTNGPNNKFDVLAEWNKWAIINVTRLSETLWQETSLWAGIYKVKNTGLLSTNNENSIGAIVKDWKIFAYNDFSSNHIVFANLAYSSQRVTQWIEIVCWHAYFSQWLYNVSVSGERMNSLEVIISLYSLLENGTKILSVKKRHTTTAEYQGRSVYSVDFEILVQKSWLYQVQMQSDGQVDKITFSF